MIMRLIIWSNYLLIIMLGMPPVAFVAGWIGEELRREVRTAGSWARWWKGE